MCLRNTLLQLILILRLIGVNLKAQEVFDFVSVREYLCRHRKMKAAAQAKSKSSGKKEKDSEKEKGDKEKGEKEDKKTERLERQQSRHGRSSVPFHRRQAVAEDMLQFDMERIMSHLPPNPAFCPTGSTTIPPQGGSTPVPEGPMDTPNSAPSPLDPPPNLPSMEPTMPTLSPHPPSKFLGGGGGGAVNGGAPAGGGGGSQATPANSNNNSGNNNNVASGGGGGGGGGGGSNAGNTGTAGGVNSGGDKDFPNRSSGLANGSVEQQTGEPANPLPNGSLNSEFFPKCEELTSGQGAGTPQPKAAAAAVTGGAGSGVPVPPDSQLPWSALESAKKELVSNWLQSQQRCVESVLKRPSLPANDSDEEGDLVTTTLYDHHTVQEWSVLSCIPSNHPLSLSHYHSSPALHHFICPPPLPLLPPPTPFQCSCCCTHLTM